MNGIVGSWLWDSACGFDFKPTVSVEIEEPSIVEILAFWRGATETTKHDELVFIGLDHPMAPTLLGYEFIVLAVNDLLPLEGIDFYHFYWVYK